MLYSRIISPLNSKIRNLLCFTDNLRQETINRGLSVSLAEAEMGGKRSLSKWAVGNSSGSTLSQAGCDGKTWNMKSET
jgi:hypothetical protein